jgi:hypothetical protein
VVVKIFVTAAIAAMLFVGVAQAAAPTVIASMDLSGPLGAPGWRFTAAQGAEIYDPTGGQGEDKAPGPIHLCLTNDRGASCRPGLNGLLRRSSGDDLFSEPHFLNRVEIVRPTVSSALLLVRVASLHATNGDQRTALALLGYDRSKDKFQIVYTRQAGRNNNQEIRYIDKGPLKGAMIAAEPTDDAPFGFWVSVSRPGNPGPYRQVLRYRSATRYGDGNPLAVIDSEMPNILQRLGLWRSGMPLPMPQGKACPRARLIDGALWCN